MKYIKEFLELNSDISNFEASPLLNSSIENCYYYKILNKENGDVIIINFLFDEKESYCINFSMNNSFEKVKTYSLAEYNNLLSCIINVVKLFLKHKKVNILKFKSNSIIKLKIYKKLASMFSNNWIMKQNFNLITLTRKSFLTKIKQYFSEKI